MSIYTKIGDIYRVHLENSVVRFMHSIAKDDSELHSDVLRIFRRHYGPDENPSIDTILNDEVECYMHTYARYGLKWNIWEKYGYRLVDKEQLGPIWFRASQDVGKYPLQQIVSKNWVVWSINGPRVYVGKLPEEFHSADLGGVYAPEHIVYRLKTGEPPDK